MEQLDRRRESIDDRLVEIIDGVEPDQLHEEIEHVVLSGGKRVRPLVTLYACETVGGDPADALDYAAGIELVHSASLVVDDIIDRSRLRRGSQSAWVEYGHGPAIVASDGLLGEAFDLFANDPRATRVVADAMVDLGVGEATELSDRPTSEAEYMTLARRKTGALFRAAASLGGIAAGANRTRVEALGEFAERVGVAFQIRDDVLDATAEQAELGKPTGHDAALERPSLVEVTPLSPNDAMAVARAEVDAAIESLDRVDPEDPMARDRFRELAEFVIERER